jgi:hypothetical protein
VSGQVRASSKERIPDFPTEAELAQRVYPLPNGVNGQLLAGGESIILPVTKAERIIRLFLEHSKAFLAREGRLTIKDADGLDYAGGVHFKQYTELVGKITLILLDKDSNECVSSFTASTISWALSHSKKEINRKASKMVPSLTIGFMFARLTMPSKAVIDQFLSGMEATMFQC